MYLIMLFKKYLILLTIILMACLITYPIKSIMNSQYFSTFIFVFVVVYSLYSFCFKVFYPLPESEQPKKSSGFLDKILNVLKNRPCEHGLNCAGFIFMILFLIIIGFSLYKKISYYGRDSPQSYLIIITMYYIFFLIISYFIISGFYNSLLKK